MASFASSATTGGARKHAWTKKYFLLHISSSYAKILGQVGENNGQLRFVRHHGWRTQACLDQNN